MRQVIAGNWKMFGRMADVAPFAARLRAATPSAQLLVCPPYLLVAPFAAALAGAAAVGGQDCHFAEAGAHTGDVSAAMLADAGATHVILGHSERRADHAESNAIVRAKAQAAVAAGLVPIICVGETGDERDAGEAEDVVRTQLRHSLPEDFSGLIAYEPVWAIGTGRTPTSTDITAMHAAIRVALGVAAIPILYGGSVKPENAAAILALPEVGGALVGGASLKAEDFLAIAACARAD